MKISFEKLYTIIQNWTWTELSFGLNRSILVTEDIISYATLILTENVPHFDLVLNLAIANNDEVVALISLLSSFEKNIDTKKAQEKWLFALIFYFYIYYRQSIYETLDFLYTEFDYPKEIEPLIPYMPCDDSASIDERLDKYIQRGKKQFVFKDKGTVQNQ